MNCGRSSSVEWKLPKLQRRVRFPSPAPPPPGYTPGGFVMPPRQARLASHALFYLPLAPSRSLTGAHPVQNSPSSQPSGRHRYKTPPAPPKWPISARFTPAGRTLYRSHHQQVEQGELCTARGANAGTKLPQLAAQRATPVQNSPSTPKMAHFSTFYASWENFIPLAPPTGRAGRKKSRTNTPPHPPMRPSLNSACNSIA